MASIVERGGKFLVRISRKGHPQINRTFTTRRDAESFARSTEVDIERGAFRQDRGDRLLFSDLLTKYKAEITPAKRSAVVEEYRIDALLRVESVARPMLNRFVSDLKPHHVATWRDARLKQVAPATVVHEWALFSHVLEIVKRDWGHSGVQNPFKIARKPAVDDARDRRISSTEIDAICGATRSTEMPVFVRLAVETCARRGELLALQWQDVDLRKRTAVLRQTKNGEQRTIPLSGAAVELLQDLPRNLNGSVFTLRPDSMTQTFQAAVKRARAAYEGDDPTFLVDVRLHDARHEGVSRLAERGWSTLEVAAVSGHKTLSLLSRYTHLRAEDLAAKMQRGVA